jgi:hypothetical protein
MNHKGLNVWATCELASVIVPVIKWIIPEGGSDMNKTVLGLGLFGQLSAITKEEASENLRARQFLASHPDSANYRHSNPNDAFSER